MTQEQKKLLPKLTAEELAVRRKMNERGEAISGLWRRVSYSRALIEGLILFTAWRLLYLVPVPFWPSGIFPLILLLLLTLRISPPIWSTLRVIAPRREKMSVRFIKMSALLAAGATGIDMLINLFIGEAMDPFGGPASGPDIQRLLTKSLPLGTFALHTIEVFGGLLVYYFIAVICVRLAQGGFLRFTMPSGDGRVTL